jgi:CHAD domain-containing protein
MLSREALAGPDKLGALPSFAPGSMISQRHRNMTAGEARPDRVHVSPPRCPSPVEQLRHHWDQYCHQLRRCHKHPTEGSVHKLRVATRRLMVQLFLVKPVLPGAPVSKARRILKQRFKALGELRDNHVQLGLVRRCEPAWPEVQRLVQRLEKDERSLTKTTARRIRRLKHKKLCHCIEAVMAALTARAVRASGQRQFMTTGLLAATHAYRRVRELRQAIDPADPATIHTLRLAFKKFRYLAESLSPAATGLGPRELRALGLFQRKMGLIQDLEMLAGSVADFVREHPARARSLASFRQHLDRRRARALRSFLKAADRADQFWPPPALTSAQASGPRRVLRFRLNRDGSVQYAGHTSAEPGAKPATTTAPTPLP